MFIAVDFYNRHILTVENPRVLALGQYHALDDFPGYRFYAVKEARGALRLSILRGSVLVQEESVPLMGIIGGWNKQGKTRNVRYQIDLDPRRPIFPLVSLVKSILDMNVPDYCITPMTDRGRVDDWAFTPEAAAHTQMASNVHVLVTSDSGMRRFVVTNPAWTVRYHGPTIDAVRLWPTADDGNNGNALLQTIRTIQSGGM